MHDNQANKSISCVTIILRWVIGGVVFALLASWVVFLLSKEQPHSLSPLPGRAVKVLGIETEYFFEADPIVQMANGKVYKYEWSKGEYLWGEGYIPDDTEDIPCQQENIEQIEAAAGKILSCREVLPKGEWCSAPLTMFAISEDGGVWTWKQEKPCILTTSMFAILFGIVGFVIGVVIVVVMRIRLGWKD